MADCFFDCKDKTKSEYRWSSSITQETAIQTLKLLAVKEGWKINLFQLHPNSLEIAFDACNVELVAWECEHLTPNNLAKLVEQRSGKRARIIEN